MARIPSSGSALGSLDERRQTLAGVLSELGFRKLTKAQEESIRGTLSVVIGQWMMAEGTGSTAGLTVKSVTASLRGLAKDLENVARVLSAVSTGFHANADIEVAIRLAGAVRQLPTFQSNDKVYSDFARFAEEATLLSQSAFVAAELLETTPLRPGRARKDWHDTFARATASLCRLNGVPLTVTTDRVTGKSTGRILDVMRALEGLLPKGMRAPSMKARVQRLHRSNRKSKTSKK